MTRRDRLVFGDEFERRLERDLDPGIAAAVRVLRRAGIETYESCEGGPGHSYPEPAVRFHGQRYEGFRALSAAILGSDEIGLRLYALRRFWTIEDAEPVGPTWELVWLPATRA